MNGQTNRTSRSMVFDTNIIIRYVNRKPGFIDLETRFSGNDWFISLITKIELLAFPGIDAAEKEGVIRFLKTVSIVPLTEKIEAAAIEIRRKFRPKLPDAIIAATACVLDAALVTGDGPLAKKKIPGLEIIFVPSPVKTGKKTLSKSTLKNVALGCFILSTLVFAILFILK